MTLDDVKLMVAATKQTKDWQGLTAWTTPDGHRTASFQMAVQLWWDFMSC